MHTCHLRVSVYMYCRTQVALEKSKGNLSGAIELLRRYVDVYMLDREAWEELGELYLEVSPVLGTICMCK